MSAMDPDPSDQFSVPEARPARTAALVVATAALATMGWLGVYLMAFGTDDASATPERTVPVGLTPGGLEDRPGVAASGGAKQPSLAARARAAAAKMPKGRLGYNEGRIALRTYTDAVGLDLSNTASPTNAARSACRLLGTGTEPKDLVAGVAEGGRITKAESRAFLLGAATLYCPKEAKAFDRAPKR